MKIDHHIISDLQSRIAKAEQRAFEELYLLFFARLYHFALLYVHKKEIGEELVNDVMVKLWEKRDSILEIRDLETYLFVAVRNHALNYLSRYSTLHVVPTVENGMAEVVNLNDPERELEWKEINFQLNQAIDKLPDQCRTVFRLIKEEGFRYRQVAEILNISHRTVETQLLRALKKLDKVLNVYIEKKQSRKRKNNLR